MLTLKFCFLCKTENLAFKITTRSWLFLCFLVFSFLFMLETQPRTLSPLSWPAKSLKYMAKIWFHLLIKLMAKGDYIWTNRIMPRLNTWTNKILMQLRPIFVSHHLAFLDQPKVHQMAYVGRPRLGHLTKPWSISIFKKPFAKFSIILVNID